jgi:hypothetical protein
MALRKLLYRGQDPPGKGGYINQYGVRVPNPCGEIDTKKRDMDKLGRHAPHNFLLPDILLDYIQCCIEVYDPATHTYSLQPPLHFLTLLDSLYVASLREEVVLKLSLRGITLPSSVIDSWSIPQILQLLYTFQSYKISLPDFLIQAIRDIADENYTIILSSNHFDVFTENPPLLLLTLPDLREESNGPGKSN